MSLLEILRQHVQRDHAGTAAPPIVPSAEELDSCDPLAYKRREFALPANTIYLDGNSLGPLPLVARSRAQVVVDQQWGDDLITSWNAHGWIDLPQTVGDKIAPLLGADVGQVVCCDSISVNLFKLLSVALSMRPGRKVVLSQQDNFPTDLYVAQGLQALLGDGRCELKTVAEQDIEAALDDEVAVVLLTQVNFRSGYAHDIAQLTKAAHDQGALVIWDLAHSAGVMPLALDQWQVDFAVGCGYKYLNGGPGAPSFLYAAHRHHDALFQPLAGWMGHDTPFAFSPDYKPAPGVRQFLAGTPSVISMSVLDASLDVFRDVDIDQLHSKALGLADYFALKVIESPELVSLVRATPLEHAERGGQLAYAHEDAYAICRALIDEGVVADFRAPNILRFGFSPLFLSFADIDKAVAALARIVRDEVYRDPAFTAQQKVT